MTNYLEVGKWDCKEKTIQVSKDGIEFIYYWDYRSYGPQIVGRQSRASRVKCAKKGHEFREVFAPGHGKWKHVCCKCGALAR